MSNLSFLVNFDFHSKWMMTKRLMGIGFGANKESGKVPR